ncbi:unnamed protein product [Sphagnum balticum]
MHFPDEYYEEEKSGYYSGSEIPDDEEYKSETDEQDRLVPSTMRRPAITNYESMELLGISIELREDYRKLIVGFDPTIGPRNTGLFNRVGLQTEDPLNYLIAECELLVQSVSTQDDPERRRAVDDPITISEQADFDRLNDRHENLRMGLENIRDELETARRLENTNSVHKGPSVNDISWFDPSKLEASQENITSSKAKEPSKSKNRISPAAEKLDETTQTNGLALRSTISRNHQPSKSVPSSINPLTTPHDDASETNKVAQSQDTQIGRATQSTTVQRVSWMRKKLPHLAKQPPPLSSQLIMKDSSTQTDILAQNNFVGKPQSREATLSPSKPAVKASKPGRYKHYPLPSQRIHSFARREHFISIAAHEDNLRNIAKNFGPWRKNHALQMKKVKRRAKKAEVKLAEAEKGRDRWRSKSLRQTTVLDALDYNNKKLGKELKRVKAELKRLQDAEKARREEQAQSDGGVSEIGVSEDVHMDDNLEEAEVTERKKRGRSLDKDERSSSPSQKRFRGSG